MSDNSSVFSCTHCGAKFKGPSTAQKVRCVKCQKVVERTMAAVPPPIPKSPTSRPQATRAASINAPSPHSPPAKPEPLGVFGYCWRSYADTHTALPWLFGAILGMILIPALSFSKPRIGIQPILGWFVLTGLMAFLSFAVLSMTACVNFLFRRQRQIPEGHTTWLSATTCFFFTLSVALGACGIAESFGPSKGILVTLIPQLQNEQARIFRDATATQPETESLASNSGDHDATVSVAQDSSDSTVAEASGVSTSKPIRASKPAATLETSDASDIEARQASPKPSPKRNTPDSSHVIAQVDDEAQQTSEPDRPKTPKPTDSNSTAKTQEVVAEGVGATADEAIKDAYRKAVRQVVGAVVDDETLVRNDEIIDDKVLTYSDGFIKKYEEVAGSKKVKDGLHRIKIKAQVERRSVIAKLKAANVTVKEVDGKGLFAEAVTQLDAEKDAAALLKKQFEGFPQSCITATIIGEPELVTKTDEKATVKITVQIEPDLKAYKAFADKLIPILDKLAKDKGEFTAKFQRDEPRGLLHPVHRNGSTFGHASNIFKEWMPKYEDSLGDVKKGQVTLAVAATRTTLVDRIDYKYYVMDASVAPVLKEIAARSSGSCVLQLLNADGETIVTDRFEDREEWNETREYYFVASPIFIPEQSPYRTADAKITVMILSPAFLAGNFKGPSPKKTLTFARSLTLSSDELKSVKDAKVEITFDK